MSEMLTAAKWAESLGVSQGKIKKAITELNIEPDEKKADALIILKLLPTKLKLILSLNNNKNTD